MELEWQQLDLRYEVLRRRNAERERQLLASLAEVGQLLPVVVVRGESAGQFVLVDGYKRVRAGRRLRWDTVAATVWELGEAEALLLERMMRTGEADSALEQGWLLRELRERFGLSQPELARRFDRSQSWVSRRLALVGELPTAMQEQVRSGVLSAHAAMRYLAPMARAMPGDCARLLEAIRPLRLSSRQVGMLYAGWLQGSGQIRERLLADPMLFLRARAESGRPAPEEKSPLQQLFDDLETLGAVARRAERRLRGGWLSQLLPTKREEAGRCLAQARADVETLYRRWRQEVCGAGPSSADGHPRAEEEGARSEGHCTDAGGGA
jgi:ParB/RepB/Spo0J family partition protein